MDQSDIPAPSGVLFNKATPPNVVTLVLIAGIGPLAMNIFLPSLPAMAEFFAQDYSVVQLAVPGYLAMTAILQLIVGPLSDRYGRRPVMIAGLLVFLVATLACALSTNFWVFLFFRLVQAAVGSGMVLSRAIVRDMVEPSKAASMIAYVTMGMALVPMFSPMIGGVLGAYYGWQASFYFALFFGFVVLAVAWFDLGETNTNPSASLTEQFKSYPELVTSHRFWGYALVAAFASGSFFAFLGGGPWVASEILHIPEDSVGLYFGVIALGYMFGNLVSGRVSERVGINMMMMSGSLVSAIGTLIAIALFAAGIIHPLSLFAPIALVGFGNGITLPSANAGIVSVRPQLAGSASGLGGAVMIGGGAGLAAITGALLSPDRGAYPLLGMMCISSMLGILAALFVIRRSRIVQG